MTACWTIVWGSYTYVKVCMSSMCKCTNIVNNIKGITDDEIISKIYIVGQQFL